MIDRKGVPNPQVSRFAFLILCAPRSSSQRSVKRGEQTAYGIFALLQLRDGYVYCQLCKLGVCIHMNCRLDTQVVAFKLDHRQPASDSGTSASRHGLRCRHNHCQSAADQSPSLTSRDAAASLNAHQWESTSSANRQRPPGYATQRQRSLQLQIRSRQCGDSDQFKELCLQHFDRIMPQKPLIY